VLKNPTHMRGGGNNQHLDTQGKISFSVQKLTGDLGLRGGVEIVMKTVTERKD